MKEFLVKKGPYLRAQNKTSKMMRHLLLALLPIVVFSFYKNGIVPFIHGKVDIAGMLYPLFFILIGPLVSLIGELLFMRLFQGKKKEILKEDIKESFAIFPGLFLTLILPLNTPISIVILGTLFATIIGKMLFGGFGNNVFNPALVGRLFIITTYALVITNHGGYMNPYEVDTVSKATPLSNVATVEGIGTFDTLVKPYGSLWDFFLGTIPGAVGETSALLCLLAFFYLTYTKVIKWRIPVIYIGTVFLMTMIVGFLNGTGIWYPLFQILSGGLFFGAVFMATDPVTSPTTSFGQILYGLSLGILTVVFRYLTPYPEGVLTSILTMNMFVFILDKVGSRFRFQPRKYGLVLLPFILVMGGIVAGIHTTMALPETDPDFRIVSRTEENSQLTYIVTQKGYGGNIEAKIVVQDGKATTFEVQKHSETFYQKIEDASYIDRLLKEQENLNEVDTISGATVSSSALRKMLVNTLKDAKNGGHSDIVTPPPAPTPPEFVILDKQVLENTTTYIVTQKSFGGLLKLQITMTLDQITDIEVLEQHDSYFQKILENDYITTLLSGQQDLEAVDAVSGATVSSNALKKALKGVLADYRGEAYEG